MYIGYCTRIVCGRYIWRRCDPKKWKKSSAQRSNAPKATRKKPLLTRVSRRRGKNWCFYLWSLARRRKIIKNFSSRHVTLIYHIFHAFFASRDSPPCRPILASWCSRLSSARWWLDGTLPKKHKECDDGTRLANELRCVCECRWMGWDEVGIVTTLLHHVLWSKNLQRLNKNISLIPKVLLLKKKKESSQAMYQHTKRQKS